MIQFKEFNRYTVLMQPAFSVLMSVYAKDRPAWVRKALETVLSNSVKPAEVVVVIDGPIPADLQDILTEFSHNYPQVKLHPLAKNGGLGAALAYGLQQCSNELVARMDADDISYTNRFEKQLAYFNAHPETAVLGGQIKEVNSNTLEEKGRRIVPQTDTEIKQFLRVRCPFNHMTVMYKKSAVLAAGNYTPFHLMEDYYLWARMAAKGFVMANLPDVVLDARVDNAMYDRRGGWKYFKSNLAMSKKLWELNLISLPTYAFNVCVRFCVQVLMPNNIRSYFYKKTLRKNISTKKYRIGYTTGVYDMFHIGHLNILKSAKEQCEYLIVGVTTDALCFARKQKYPIIPEKDRMDIVRAIKYVDKVIPQEDMNKLTIVQQHHVNAVFVGSDWRGSNTWKQYEKDFFEKGNGCQVVYLDHTDGISSTILRDKLNKL